MIDEFDVLTNKFGDGFYFNYLKFLFPLPFDDKYLALFKLKNRGSYCVMDGIGGKVVCNLKFRSYKLTVITD